MRDLMVILRETAERYPTCIAVSDAGREINYADFIGLVDRISKELLTRKSNPKILLDLGQRVESYAIIVAVVNIGGAYCPLNPESPIERKAQVFEQFKPDLLICDQNDLAWASHYNEVVTVTQLLSGVSECESDTSVNEEDVSYVIYTSGTTGRPKGVMIRRKSLNKFLDWSIPAYAAKVNEIWGQFSSLSFDLSIVDIFTCLCSGATLLAMNDLNSRKYRPSEIIERERLSIWHSIPSAVEFMIRAERAREYDFSSLRIMSFCGELLKKHQVEFLFSKNRDLIIFNTYGPTEGTLFCTWQEVRHDTYMDYCDRSISIGKPIPGWNIMTKPVEGFDELEIVLYGDFIGVGYLNTIESQKFGWVTINGKQEWRFETGDLVCERSGNLYFAGRNDRQVKIKGFRVELDEIDFLINRFLNLPCTTVVRNDILYSFIETEGEFDEPRIREFLKSKVEYYKIPNRIYSISEFPRNRNQKIDIEELIGKIL